MTYVISGQFRPTSAIKDCPLGIVTGKGRLDWFGDCARLSSTTENKLTGNVCSKTKGYICQKSKLVSNNYIEVDIENTFSKFLKVLAPLHLSSKIPFWCKPTRYLPSRASLELEKKETPSSNSAVMMHTVCST